MGDDRFFIGDDTQPAFFVYEGQHEISREVSSLIRNSGDTPVTRAGETLTLFPTPGTYDIIIERVDGIQNIGSTVVSAAGYVVPNSVSPLRQVAFS